jgi:hypothetical protein
VNFKRYFSKNNVASLAYALDGGGLGDAPVFVQPPGQVTVELDPIGGQRLFGKVRYKC